MKMKAPSETHRHYRGSPFGSPNMCISDFADAPSKFLEVRNFGYAQNVK